MGQQFVYFILFNLMSFASIIDAVHPDVIDLPECPGHDRRYVSRLTDDERYAEYGNDQTGEGPTENAATFLDASYQYYATFIANDELAERWMKAGTIGASIFPCSWHVYSREYCGAVRFYGHPLKENNLAIVAFPKIKGRNSLAMVYEYQVSRAIRIRHIYQMRFLRSYYWNCVTNDYHDFPISHQFAHRILKPVNYHGYYDIIEDATALVMCYPTEETQRVFFQFNYGREEDQYWFTGFRITLRSPHQLVNYHRSFPINFPEVCQKDFVRRPQQNP